ncbi:MAG: hypothetical protein QXT66_05810 [Nitrososphaerota archaeon]
MVSSQEENPPKNGQGGRDMTQRKLSREINAKLEDVMMIGVQKG